MEFEVQQRMQSGEGWQTIGTADATGEQAGATAVGELAHTTGWYRARPVIDPNAAWAFYQLSVDANTGQPVAQYSETPPL